MFIRLLSNKCEIKEETAGIKQFAIENSIDAKLRNVPDNGWLKLYIYDHWTDPMVASIFIEKFDHGFCTCKIMHEDRPLEDLKRLHELLDKHSGNAASHYIGAVAAALLQNAESDEKILGGTRYADILRPLPKFQED